MTTFSCRQYECSKENIVRHVTCSTLLSNNTLVFLSYRNEMWCYGYSRPTNLYAFCVKAMQNKVSVRRYDIPRDNYAISQNLSFYCNLLIAVWQGLFSVVCDRAGLVQTWCNFADPINDVMIDDIATCALVKSLLWTDRSAARQHRAFLLSPSLPLCVCVCVCVTLSPSNLFKVIH